MTVIHDQGYRAYEGERAGLGWSMWSLGIDAARRAFGLKRPARFKILPAVVIAIAFIPAIVLVGMTALISDFIAEGFTLPSYGEYYGFSGPAMVLFAALVAPDVLSTDRRTGMLALYMASPLDRTSYIVSKVTAVFTILLVITFLPLLFLLVANTLAGVGPDGLGDFIKTLGKIVAAGFIASLFFTGLSMVVSAFTKRRGIASIGIVGAMLIPTILVNVMLESQPETNSYVGLLDIAQLPFFSAARIFDGDAGQFDLGQGQLGTGVILLTTIALSVAALAVTWFQYQRVEIDR